MSNGRRGLGFPKSHFPPPETWGWLREPARPGPHHPELQVMTGYNSVQQIIIYVVAPPMHPGDFLWIRFCWSSAQSSTMVGGGGTADLAPTAAVKIFSAGAAGCVADLVTFPLDTAKVRLQVRIHSLPVIGHKELLSLSVCVVSLTWKDKLRLPHRLPE